MPLRTRQESAKIISLPQFEKSSAAARLRGSLDNNSTCTKYKFTKVANPLAESRDSITPEKKETLSKRLRHFSASLSQGSLSMAGLSLSRFATPCVVLGPRALCYSNHVAQNPSQKTTTTKINI